MKSTMFLNNITAIDHAYIDKNGLIVGGSLSPIMRVSGDVDEKESVVVDFSAVKKEIKRIIDSKYSGFDHKLWIIHGYSDATYVESIDGMRWIIRTPNMIIEAPKSAVKIIRTPNMIIEAPKSAVKIITDYLSIDYTYDESVAAQIKHEVEAEMRITYPAANITVSVRLEPAFIGSTMMNSTLAPFRYVHGLKDSTSWGCQNIAHGHLSYLGANTGNVVETNILLSKIASILDCVMFVKEENIMYQHGDTIIFGYDTPRGIFRITMPFEGFSNNCIVLDSETTVENLVEYIAAMFKPQLREAGVFELFVSEGLNKGACVRID